MAAFPGRISQADDAILICRDPVFGASRHIASVIIAAMQHAPEIRSAMNIRFHPDILAACEKLGFRIVSFDRGNEPGQVKKREGSTLEWGTDQALSKQTGGADVIYDRGEIGKEPMIRVLGKHPAQVVDMVDRIHHAWV